VDQAVEERGRRRRRRRRKGAHGSNLSEIYSFIRLTSAWKSTPSAILTRRKPPVDRAAMLA
jgi:hypothetical protein